MFVQNFINLSTYRLTEGGALVWSLRFDTSNKLSIAIWEARMSHLYFDLTMDDEHFPDPVGETVTDLTAAHARAVLLVRRVMMFSESDAETPRAKRGVVTIKDDTGRVLLSVIVPCEVPDPSHSTPPSQPCSPGLAARQIARSSRPPVVENSSSSQ